MDEACNLHGEYVIMSVRIVGHLVISAEENIQRKSIFVAIINNNKQIYCEHPLLPSVSPHRQTE
jgi:hypothetical protein